MKGEKILQTEIMNCFYPKGAKNGYFQPKYLPQFAAACGKCSMYTYYPSVFCNFHRDLRAENYQLSQSI